MVKTSPSKAVGVGLIPGQGAKGFPGGLVVKNPPAIAGDSEDTSLIPG